MNKYHLLTTILLASLFFVSCHNSELQKKQLAKIDSLVSVIDTTSNRLNNINMDTVRSRYKKYKSTNGQVADGYQKFRNEENWQYVCAFQNVRKPLKIMIADYPLYRADLDSTKKQLLNLKHDVEKNLLDENDFNRYLLMEAKSANELTFKVNRQIDLVLKQFENFDTVYPYLLKLLEKYPKK